MRELEFQATDVVPYCAEGPVSGPPFCSCTAGFFSSTPRSHGIPRDTAAASRAHQFPIISSLAVHPTHQPWTDCRV